MEVGHGRDFHGNTPLSGTKSAHVPQRPSPVLALQNLAPYIFPTQSWKEVNIELPRKEVDESLITLTLTNPNSTRP